MVIVAIVGYLLGSIPTALIVGHFRDVDPRMLGDRNPGWWNMRRLVGDGLALVVLVGDFAKGALAAWVGALIWGPWWMAYIALFFALLGHAFPLFAGFRGGRSATPLLGGLFVLFPIPILLTIATGAIFALGSHQAINGVRVGIVALPLIQGLFQPASYVLATCGLMAFVLARFAVAKGSPALFRLLLTSR